MFLFTADTHFCDPTSHIRDMLPFSDYRAKDSSLIANINKAGTKDDILFHLGDFCTYNANNHDVWEKGLTTVKYLHPKVILVIGNNEQRIIDEQFGGYFEDFKLHCMLLGFMDVLTTCYRHNDDKLYLMSHIPLPNDDIPMNTVNLHGHYHLESSSDSKHFNVGAATNFLRPYSMEDVKFKIKQFELCNEDRLRRSLQCQNAY